MVFTHKYCPQEYLCDPSSLYPGINGETADDFETDCRRQIIGMELADCDAEPIDRHIAGLMAVVIDHLSRCDTLPFLDLLIYVDCFSLLLESAGFPEEEIKEIYPRVTRTIVELFHDRIRANHPDTVSFPSLRPPTLFLELE